MLKHKCLQTLLTDYLLVFLQVLRLFKANKHQSLGNSDSHPSVVQNLSAKVRLTVALLRSIKLLYLSSPVQTSDPPLYGQFMSCHPSPSHVLSLVSYTTPHYTTLHYTTPHYTRLHYTTLHYTTLHYTSIKYATLHYTTQHYTTLNYTTLN